VVIDISSFLPKKLIPKKGISYNKIRDKTIFGSIFSKIT